VLGSGARGARRGEHYLALGDSLSPGVQPDAADASVETPQGYPDLVHAQLRRGHPGLRLVQPGCPGETTEAMMHGGICRYPGGSQLAAAVTSYPAGAAPCSADRVLFLFIRTRPGRRPPHHDRGGGQRDRQVPAQGRRGRAHGPSSSFA
jgi:hypothetical protein